MSKFDFIERNTSVFTSPNSYSTFFMTKDGNLHAMGPNRYCSLGIDDGIDRSTPDVVRFFDNLEVVDIACGMTHSIFKCSDGSIYACGSNLEGQLGQGEEGMLEESVSPQPVKYFDSIGVKQICCGMFSSYCLASDGVLYAFGRNYDGQIGDGTTTGRPSPVLVRVPAEASTAMISAGALFGALLSTDGEVMTWGNNIEGQCGRGGDTRKPMPVDFNLESHEKMICVRCGGVYAVALSETNKCFIWGYISSGAGVVGSFSTIPSPQRVSFFDDKPIISIRLGGSHGCIRAEEDGEAKFFTFGSNDYSQLFHGEDSEYPNPSKVKDISELVDGQSSFSPLEDVFSGSWHTILVTHSGRSYIVGRRVTYGDTRNTQIPTLLLEDVAPVRHDYTRECLLRYIQEEQSLPADIRTADMSITTIDEGGVSHSLSVNRAYLEARFGTSSVSCVLANGKSPRDLLMEIYGGSSCTLKMHREGRVVDLVGKSLPETMRALYDAREEGDVSIESDLDIHRAHRFMLVARREYFKAMFQGGWVESYSSTVRLEMHLGKSFGAYLRYLYTGERNFKVEDFDRLISYVEYFDEDKTEDILLRSFCLGRKRRVG